MNISVLGCGRWGSFIGWYLDKIGHNVMLWGRPGSARMQEIKTLRKNPFLDFKQSIAVTDDLLATLNHSDVVAISISAQALRNLAFLIKSEKVDLSKKIFVLCMKGIEENTGERLSEVLKECLGEKTKIAIWVGPGHVQEYASGIPNCMVIDSDSDEIKNFLVKNFSSPLIRFYYGADMIGNEIGAAAKNVMGIAAGVLDGMNYQSLKGALMARGTREIARLIKAMGGNEFSAYGLAHLGDYQATLFSPHSNNRKFGESLVKHGTCDKLAEGVATSGALVNLGKKYGVSLPISEAVHDAVSGKTLPEEAVYGLLSRKIVSEF